MVSGEDIVAIEAPKKTTAPLPKKTSSSVVAKKPASHPPYLEMIQKGIKHLKERGGSSRQAILKYIMANYSVGDQQAPINARVKTALKNGVKLGSLTQSKGTGASGSFRIADGKKRAVKPKIKKTPTKARKTVKSQKKVKKPKAAKRSKSASPRKSMKKTLKRKPARSPLKKSKMSKPKKTKSPRKKATKSRR